MMLDRLPPNITGFFDKSEEPRSLSGADFKQACYHVAQITGGRVEAIDLNLLGRGYFSATIQRRTDHVPILCNSVYPYVAFVEPRPLNTGSPSLTFVGASHLSDAFARATNFQPLDAAWLNSDLSSNLLSDLTPSEQGQIVYWKPERVGEVVFNTWD